MERATLLANGNPIEPGHFLLDPDTWPLFGEEVLSAESNGVGDTATPQAEEQGGLGMLGEAPASTKAESFFGDAVIPLHEMERIMIMKGLEATSGNRTQAAELLGISVRTLRNKLNEYRAMGIEIE